MRKNSERIKMTKQEEKEIIRVCGKNYSYEDIPAYIRQRDEAKEDEAREDETEEIVESAESLEEAEERLEAL